MHYRIQNVVFLLVFLVVISMTLATKTLSFIGFDFPEWTGVGKDFSQLEGREYSNLPKVSLDKITSSEFQDEFEQFMSDSLPLKEDALFLNAFLQRSVISLSNTVFGYEVYPTFFDSDYVYSAGNDMLYQTLKSSSEITDSAYETAAEKYKEFSARHSDIDMYFYKVDRLSSSNNNPTNEYITNPINTDYLDEHFFNLFDDQIKVIDGTLESGDEAVTAFFRTDHHWNIEYAYEAYCSILSQTIPEATPISYAEYFWEQPAFFGSLSRSGLCLPENADHIKDYYVDLADLEVIVNGKAVNSGSFLDHAKEYSSGEWGEDKYTNRYPEYFHGDYGLIEIHNTALNNDRSLLIVGDSFSDNMERFFTGNYEKVYVIDFRHTDMSLDEFLEDAKVDDIVFLLGSTNMATEETVSALS